MFDLPDIRIDRFSFWVGFLAATLLWWLWQRIRPYFPQWREQIKKSINNLRQKSFAAVEEYLRREAVRRAQRQHLAAPLFPLDDIIIQPRLIAPPAFQHQDMRTASQSIASQVIPYLPEWPEMVTQLGVATISPLEAVLSGRNIAIIGQPGCGKTVVLAHLACQIARKYEEISQAGIAGPLMVHILDLDTSHDENSDPVQSLMKRLSAQSSIVLQPQIMRFLKTVFRDKSRRTVLLIDGLDELPPEQLSETVAYLAALRNQQPRLQMVVTASPDFMDGLTRAGFYPLSVAAWGTAERDELVKKWGNLWTTQLLPEFKKQVEVKEIDPVLFNYWLGGDPTYYSPLEWTVRLWGAFTGDLSGSLPMGILDSYISRYLPDTAFIPALEELGHAMVQKSSPSLGYDEIEQILSSFKPQTTALPAAEHADPQMTGNTDNAEPVKKQRKKSRRDITAASQGERIITALVNGGVLLEHANNQIRFSNPVFLGFLAGMRITAEEAEGLAKKLDWSVSNLTLQYSAACSEQPAWIYPLITNPVQPLFRNLLIASRWLRDAPANAEWRTYMMRTLFGLIQTDYLPLGVRARCAAAFLLTRDPSTVKLFKQLLISKSDYIRRIGLMGSGALGNAQLINDVVQLLADPVAEVRLTACLALAAIPGDVALNGVVNVLLSGNEEVRQAAAESLARNETEGHKLLEEAAVVEDLLTRRAAVFGLLQVHNPWAQQILEKIAVEDGQWVVRNAAAQALEMIQHNSQAVPKLLPPPSESPWLLTFASKLGKGVLPGQPATEILLQAVKTGAPEEQIGALQYLREQPEEGIVREIYQLIYSGHEELHEPALHALWWMTVSGSDLPSPQQFGLG